MNFFKKIETHTNLGTKEEKNFLNCTIIANKEEIKYLQNFPKLNIIARNCTEFYGIVRNFTKLHGIVRSFTKLNRIARNSSFFYIK